MPLAVDPWSGTLDATNFGPTCYQTYINPILQNLESEEANGNVSEDCLTVDIYIPRFLLIGQSEIQTLNPSSNRYVKIF